MSPVFVDLKGYEGLYKVSTYGQIISLKREVKIFGKHVFSKPTIFLKLQTHYKGYKFVHVCKNGIREKVYIHRAVALHFIINKNPDELIIVNHKDLDKTNNHVLNLEWVTSKENTNHYHQNKDNDF